MTRNVFSAQGTHCFTTEELLEEIRRRSLGCMIAVIRAEESGDTWRYALKGSPILLGALSAALNLETRRRLAGLDEDGVSVAI